MRARLREAILACRIEDTLTKQQILELYLNQIALGRNAFGVEAAAHAYFDKDVDELDAARDGLSRDPAQGAVELRSRPPHRARARAAQLRARRDAARTASSPRRSATQAGPSRSAPCRARRPSSSSVGGYFVEEVRRQLIDKFGETDEDGPYSVYAGGLWVRTSLDPELQELCAEGAARRPAALRARARLVRADRATIEIDGDDWQQRAAQHQHRRSITRTGARRS